MPRQRVNNHRKRGGSKDARRERGNPQGAREEKQGRPASREEAPSSAAHRPLRTADTPTRELRRLLEGIGSPAPAPFKPDPFQTEALAALEHEDVLVTAPTGSGKTWIAREEIRRLLAAGLRAWYTSPLKALTNSKYQEFRAEFGDEAVGILTGDRKENGDAPLIVGTTEIYRNQLFDSLRSGTNIRADLVVLDEVHYLADEERGHVWEEAIILSPPRVRLLLLSATIGNAEEFAAWIGEVRGVHCGVVSRPGARPVPLRAAFLYPEGQLIPLLTDTGHLHPEIARLAERQQQQRQERQQRGGGDWRARRGGGGRR
jgi:ATP-dependent RNA helicase HelY